MHSFQKVVRGRARVYLHFLSSIAGMPSAPGAAVDFSSSMASIISSGSMMMLFIGVELSSILGSDVNYVKLLSLRHIGFVLGLIRLL